MLTNRIIGAFTFRKGVYAEVEQDATFTKTAWILVIVFTFLNQLGSYASEDFLDWVIGTGIGWITAIIAFAVSGNDPEWPTDRGLPSLQTILSKHHVNRIMGKLGREARGR